MTLCVRNWELGIFSLSGLSGLSKTVYFDCSLISSIPSIRSVPPYEDPILDLPLPWRERIEVRGSFVYLVCLVHSVYPVCPVYPVDPVRKKRSVIARNKVTKQSKISQSWIATPVNTLYLSLPLPSRERTKVRGTDPLTLFHPHPAPLRL